MIVKPLEMNKTGSADRVPRCNRANYPFYLKGEKQ